MNSKVNDAFDVFDQRIRLTDDALKMALDEASAISHLINADPAIRASIITGSVVRSTAIRDFSDVDVVAVLDDTSRSGAMTPMEALSLVMRIMDRHIHKIRASGNSLSFVSENGIQIDVLPAFTGRIDKHGDQVYEIPTAARSAWQEYSPDTQTRRIAEIDRRVGPRFKQLIRAIKWWSRMNGQPISSHKVEVLASDAFDARVPELPQAVATFFDVAIKDLQVTSQGVETVASTADIFSAVEVALSKLHSAGDRAKEARELELAAPDNASQAIHIWRGLFGEHFPDALS